MIKNYRLILAITVISLFHDSAFGQEYLKKVGIADSLFSQILNDQREVYIQLPDSYDPEKNQKYPVVYIIDGDVFLPTVSSVHDFYYGGFMPEMVLVGIANYDNRVRDLTTSPVKTLFGMPYNGKSGQADNFLQFIATELIPYIENKYPVTNFRTLIGHSYGGLFTTYVLLNQPGLFANYLAIDPSLNWDNQKLLNDSQNLLSNHNYENKYLFMSLSGQLHKQDYDITIDNVMQDTTEFTIFARSNISFSEVVKSSESNLSLEWKFYPNDLHGTVPLPSIMDGLIYVFNWFQMENTDKINDPSTSRNDLYEIVNYRSEKLKKHFGYEVPPYPEDLLNALGYMSMDMGQMAKSKMFFEFAIQFYPKSSNTYDSMADYFINNNDIDSALSFLTKAYELSGDEYYKNKIQELSEN